MLALFCFGGTNGEFLKDTFSQISHTFVQKSTEVDLYEASLSVELQRTGTFLFGLVSNSWAENGSHFCKEFNTNKQQNPNQNQGINISGEAEAESKN